MTNSGTKFVRRAVILAAGTSRRLESLQLGKPKPLIEVDGKPLLARHLEKCAAIGIEEVFINLHYLPDQIRAFAGDGSQWKLRIAYHLESSLVGTSGGVKGFAQSLQHEPFIVIYGDNYCTFGLEEIVRAHFGSLPRPDMSIVLFRLDDVSSSGVAVCASNGTIQSFIEKPQAGATFSHWVNSGVYLMEPELLDLIPEGVSDFGHEIIPWFLASGKRIRGVKTQGEVFAVDTPDLLNRVSIRFEKK